MISISFDLILNLALIPSFGTIGAASSTLVAKVLMTYLMLKTSKAYFLKQKSKNEMVHSNVISVCMACFNGEKYIDKMIESILVQLGPDDELVIVDDASTDQTFSVIQSFQDPRIIKIKNNKNLGPQKAFQKALRHSKGNYIFLADQDDVWLPGKVQKSLALFESNENLLLVAHEAKFTNETLQPIMAPKLNAYKNKTFFKILLKNRFIGATMCIKRSLAMESLPLLGHTPMHDWWIVLIASLKKGVGYINEPLILYRRHEGTYTTLDLGYRWHIKPIYYRFKYLILFFIQFFQLKEFPNERYDSNQPNKWNHLSS